MQAFLAAQGLQPPQPFLAAQGLQAPQAFLAAQGLQAFFGAHAAIAAGKLAVAVIVAMAMVPRARFNMWRASRSGLLVELSDRKWPLQLASANQLRSRAVETRVIAMSAAEIAAFR
ncbi:MAG: hypothetical protein QF578_03770 [Alphaproteobacteria bacterium]|nr:hypothetical protein [Alphaproteobacteria bacterium]MDP6563920.1 hypothetical protein [Alphaproteobacteria bacterium]